MAMKGSAAWILAMNSSGKIVYWAGVTTTPISDGSTTNPVMINGSSINIRPGGAVGYNGNEFVLSEDGVWQEFGETDVQHKTLDTPITVDGTEETTVEGALSAINEYAEDIEEDLETKVDKVEGKGLSTNDYSNTDKGKVDSLGTASTKNSTSVVTESSDLVESGAVKDAIVGTVGWIGGKNKYNFDISDVGANIITTANISYSDGVLSCQTTGAVSSGMYLKPASLKSKFADLANIPCIFSCKAKSSVACNGAILSDTVIAMPTEWTEFTFEVSDPSNIGALVFYNKDTSKTPIIYVKDMILEVGSTATAYEPYHPSVEDTLMDAEVIEGKNLLPTNGSKLGEENPVTFTYNSDGSVTAIGSTGSTSTDFSVPIPSELSGNFYFSGCPTGGSDSTFDVYAWDRTAGSRLKKWDGTTNSGSDFGNTSQECKLIAGHTSSIRIRIRANQSNINVTFKLMLRRPTEDDVYEPYYVPLKYVVPTKADNSVIAPVENGQTASKDYAVGDYFIKDTILGKTKAAIASGGTFTKDTNYEETNVAKELTELYKYIGILTTPVEAFTANSLPILKRNITNAFYNGSLRGEIAAGNFKNVRPGDYIIGQATGSTYYVAECDYWLGNGDSTNGTTYPAYNTHHLGLMLFKPVGTTALWRGYGYSDKSWRVSASDLGRCPWNAETTVDPTDTEAIGSNSTNITRSYNGTNMSAYMGSFIRKRIDAILLPQCFQADFGSENVLKRRNWLSNAINASAASGARSDWQGIASGSVWVDRFIDLASEVELYGSRINSSSRDDIGVQNKQLPIYRNGRIHDFYPRMDLWTKGIASATDAANRNGNGVANTSYASRAIWACPLGCVK